MVVILTDDAAHLLNQFDQEYIEGKNMTLPASPQLRKIDVS